MTRDTILHYFYQHFSMHFEVNDTIEELFFNANRIYFPYSGEHFFRSKKPKPTSIQWKIWDNENLPILFDPSTKKEWYTIEEDKLIFNYDLPSMIFYFLSGWQEEHCKTTDKFGRFPYSESIQKEYGLATLPIVNYYFFILQKAIEAFLQHPIPLKQHYQLNITHDIDLINSGWKSEIKKQLLKGQLLEAVKTTCLKITKGKDPLQNVEEIMAFEKTHRIKSTFYFLPTNDYKNGIQNADYSLDEPYIQRVIKQIKEDSDFELGLHTPSTSQLNTNQIIEYTQALGGNIATNRFHYLAFQQKDLAHFEKTDITTDSSLGFAEQIGFRHGTAWPFHPFDFEKNNAMTILEIPLVAMDVSLTNYQYMNLSESKAIEAINALILETKKVSGTLTILWHNDKFDFFKSVLPKIHQKL